MASAASRLGELCGGDMCVCACMCMCGTDVRGGLPAGGVRDRAARAATAAALALCCSVVSADEESSGTPEAGRADDVDERVNAERRVRVGMRSAFMRLVFEVLAGATA